MAEQHEHNWYRRESIDGRVLDRVCGECGVHESDVQAGAAAPEVKHIRAMPFADLPIGARLRVCSPEELNGRESVTVVHAEERMAIVVDCDDTGRVLTFPPTW